MDSNTQTTEKPDFDKVWLMFQETREQFKETREQFQDLKEILAKSSLETDKKFQETDKKFEETREQFKDLKEILAKSSFETDKKFQETDRQFKETDKKLNKLEFLFTTQWGKLIETLVEGDLVKLLRDRNIDVNRTFPNVTAFYQNKKYEFDIIAVNGTEAVVVEVKTTLSVKYVNDFLEKLKIFKVINPEHSNKKLYGAVAFLKAHSQSDTYAEGKGLFTLRATGSSASITNTYDFKPKEF